MLTALATAWAMSVSTAAHALAQNTLPSTVWYFHEPSNLSKPDQVTAVVRMKDGTVASQITDIAAGESVHRFGFPAIDKSAVQEVLLSSSGGQCLVSGP